MLNRLRAAQEERIWRAGERDEEGVVIKKSRGKYSCEPLELATEEGGLFETVQRLNVKVFSERERDSGAMANLKRSQ